MTRINRATQPAMVRRDPATRSCCSVARLIAAMAARRVRRVRVAPGKRRARFARPPERPRYDRASVAGEAKPGTVLATSSAIQRLNARNFLLACFPAALAR